MPSGYKNIANVDFDDIFEPYVSGPKSIDSGLRDNSETDLKHRYTPIEAGSKAPDVGYLSSAEVDVSNLWAALGSVITQGINQLMPSGMSIVIPQEWVGSPGISWSYSLNQDGSGTAGTGTSTPDETFYWTDDEEPPILDYEVRLIDVSVSGDPVWTFTNLVSAWSDLNSTTGRTVCTLAFGSGTATVERAVTVSGTLQIREKISGTVVFDEGFGVSGIAGTI